MNLSEQSKQLNKLLDGLDGLIKDNTPLESYHSIAKETVKTAYDLAVREHGSIECPNGHRTIWNANFCTECGAKIVK